MVKQFELGIFSKMLSFLVNRSCCPEIILHRKLPIKQKCFVCNNFVVVDAFSLDNSSSDSIHINLSIAPELLRWEITFKNKKIIWQVMVIYDGYIPVVTYTFRF